MFTVGADPVSWRFSSFSNLSLVSLIVQRKWDLNEGQDVSHTLLGVAHFAVHCVHALFHWSYHNKYKNIFNSVFKMKKKKMITLILKILKFRDITHLC